MKAYHSNPFFSSTDDIVYPTTQQGVQTFVGTFLTIENILLIFAVSVFLIVILCFILYFNKLKELELKEMRNRLSLALEAGSLSAWTYNTKTKQFSSLYNSPLSRDGLGFNAFAEIIHPEDREKYYTLFYRLTTGKEKKGTQIIRVKTGDNYEWFESHVITHLHEKSRKVHHLIGTEKNITKDIIWQRELEESRYKLELAFNAAEIIPWEFNAKTRMFTSPDPKILMYSGFPLDTLIKCTNKDDREILTNEINCMLRNEKEKSNIQVRFKFPDQEQHWFTLHSIISERDNKGNVQKIIGISRDITQLKMTDELIQLRIKADESNRLKSAFLANMSHEIRTPLNAIVGFSNLLYESNNPEEKAQFIEIIELNNGLLLQLISDILDISKIEAGELDFKYSEVDISFIFKKLYQVYKERVPKGVKLICELPEKPYTILTDQNRLAQIIANFLSNACKFTSTGHITMGYTYLQDSKLRFYVKDTGKGIAPENVPNVFQRFAKFDPFTQGTGLGLPICQSLVEVMKGEIGVESELSKGTEFWFTIPYPSQETAKNA